MPEVIKIKFQNGINKQIACNEILNELQDNYVFEESDEPDFILFGPYGNDIPQSGNYIRIGYYCENIIPDMSICEWAFGIPREEEINDHRYKRIQWHGLNPKQLVKPANYNAEAILDGKKYFCNFLYSHKVSYREAFFKQLSSCKKVDAPGKSMNNMPSIDELYTGDMWARKRQFLSEYKFTIAFENDSYPGYQTEKLYDAMLAGSVPIYFGDPLVVEVFNPASMITVGNYIKGNKAIANWLQKHCQSDFIDIRPQYYHNPAQRIKRKLKAMGRDLKMRLLFKSVDVKSLIDDIIDLDRDDAKYIALLSQPWFNGNTPPVKLSNKDRWIKIFSKQA